MIHYLKWPGSPLPSYLLFDLLCSVPSISVKSILQMAYFIWFKASYKWHTLFDSKHVSCQSGCQSCRDLHEMWEFCYFEPFKIFRFWPIVLQPLHAWAKWELGTSRMRDIQPTTVPYLANILKSSKMVTS